ncbi:MAG: hypothetical protein R6U55_13700 [Desulfovermiculus sp.]
MISRYALVSSRILQELEDLEAVCGRAERALAAVRQNPADQDLYMDSAALSMHDWYSGLERIMSFIASRLEESTPQGKDWHRDLLYQMQLEIPDVRPAVFSKSTVSRLDEYLRFRHVLRNVYSFNLQPERIEVLVSGLRETLESVRIDLERFCLFLREIAESG